MKSVKRKSTPKKIKVDLQTAIPPMQATTYSGRLVHYAGQNGWALCIGAGTSFPLFNDWNTLAANILTDVQKSYSSKNALEFVKSFGPAAAIQTAWNIVRAKASLQFDSQGLKSGDEEEDIEWWKLKEQYDEMLVTQLADIIYAKIKNDVVLSSCVTKNDWKVIVKCLTAASTNGATDEEWKSFINIVEQSSKRLDSNEPCTAIGIARCVARVLDTDRKPSAIISFNCEPLLLSLLQAFYVSLKERNVRNAYVLKRMFHDISKNELKSVLYYFIHGAVSIPGSPEHSTFSKTISDAKLIFSEEQYLSLSNRAYSWQGTNFLGVCLNYRCIFVGVSFTDPNLRRWLAWQHQGRRDERERKELPADRFQHYWITVHKDGECSPLTPEQHLISESVKHLGVSVIFVRTWSDVEERLKSMLGVTY